MHMNKKEALLNAAESKARLGGYSNFSFRELANEVGIKSASVHYHFPTKEDLGTELAKRYTEYFLHVIGGPAALITQGKVPIVCNLRLNNCREREASRPATMRCLYCHYYKVL